MYLTELEMVRMGEHGEKLFFSLWLPEKPHWENPHHVWAHAEGDGAEMPLALDTVLVRTFLRVPFRMLPLLCCCPSLWLFFFFPLQKILDWEIVLMICSVFQGGWLIWKTQQDSWNRCQKLSSVLLSQLPAFCALAAQTGLLLKMQPDIS